MAASGEMCKCGKMLHKFRILNKFRVDSQVHSKRYVRRAQLNTSNEENNENIEYRSNRPLKSLAVNAFASEKDTSEITGDFFGIEGGSGVKEIKELSSVSPVEKYSYLLHKKPASDEEPVVEEKVLITSFGSVRFDIDNHVKVHGQHDKVYVEKMSSLQPEKYLLGKLQRTDTRFSNSTKNNTSFKRQSSIDVNETNQSKFTNNHFSSSSVSVHDQPFAGVENSLDDRYFNRVKATSTDQSVESSNYNNYSVTHPGTVNNLNSHTHSAVTTEHKCGYNDGQYISPVDKPSLEQSGKNSNDNKRNLHSDNEHNNVHPTADGKNSYIDEQYFDKLKEKEDTVILNQKNVNESCNFIDDQYFGKCEEHVHGSSTSSNDLNSSCQIAEIPFSSPLITPLQNTENPYLNNINITLSEASEEKAPDNENGINQKQDYDKYQDGNSTTQSMANDSLYKESENILSSEDTKDEHYGFITVKEKREHVVPNVEDPRTAYDYVMKLRKEEILKNKERSSTTDAKNTSLGNEKLDSKGFFILKTQVQDFKYLNKDAIVTSLKNAILYNDNDIVVLSKPYGIVCSGGNTQSNGIDIQTCLPDLAKRIFKKSVDPKLFLVHSIDKETTGTLVLARTEKMADLLTGLFSQNEIKKIYWTLTRGVPDVPEGIIDIPIAEGIVDLKRRMALRPDDDETKFLAKPCKKAERAITHYNIISTKGNAALIEVKPETNVKHQIRIHLGFGLRCPILGDHKYSHLDKIAPQKLPDDMLRRLHIQQSKVRYVPMHLHLKTLIIPEILDGKNLFFHANLPSHFKVNLRRLKIRKT